MFLCCESTIKSKLVYQIQRKDVWYEHESISGYQRCLSLVKSNRISFEDNKYTQNHRSFAEALIHGTVHIDNTQWNSTIRRIELKWYSFRRIVTTLTK